MKIEELIEELKQIERKEGNIEVGFKEPTGYGNTNVSFKVKQVFRYFQSYQSKMLIIKKGTKI